MVGKFLEFPDKEFTRIIETCLGWEEISLSLGYPKKPGSYVINRIKERCNSLGIKPKLKTLESIENKTKGTPLGERKKLSKLPISN